MNNWLLKLYDAVFNAETALQIKRDYPSIEDGDDRTPLEIQMNFHLNALFDLCREHPDFSEPTHESHPELIDEDGDILPNFERVEPLSEVERDEIKTVFDDSMRKAIADFIELTKTPKSKFATVYGCTPSYLSNVLAGRKNLDFSLLVATIHKFGFTPSIDPLSKKWTFEKTTPFL